MEKYQAKDIITMNGWNRQQYEYAKRMLFDDLLPLGRGNPQYYTKEAKDGFLAFARAKRIIEKTPLDLRSIGKLTKEYSPNYNLMINRLDLVESVLKNLYKPGYYINDY